ncbi:MAG: M23 family metallopeptidase [Pseudomonadota bacterium]
MNIIIHSRRIQGAGHITLHQGGALAVLLLLLVAVPVSALVAGFKLGETSATRSPEEMARVWEAKLAEQEQRVEEIKQETRENVDVLANRLGQMQAQVIRLNALGERLTSMADLDQGEFNFQQGPAMGGPRVEAEEHEPVEMTDFMEALDELSRKLADRSRQLSVLESVMMNRKVQDEVVPAGRPVKQGWQSSGYGMRSDPFSGRNSMHRGQDFAGREGTPVYATASGVVTWAARRHSYGKLVEINHGNGYVTRYAHNSAISVEVGDTIKSGDKIAEVGSTGRSTGPHVHYEVWVNGDTVDPMQYVQRQASR